MEVTRGELETLLAMTPNMAENANIIAQLQDMYSASRVEKQLYTYTNNLAVAGAANAIAAATVSAAIATQIDASAMFLWTATTYDANTANAARTAGTYIVPNLSVLIVDQGSGRQMMDQPTPVYEIAGNGQFPYVLPEPRLIAANSTLSFTYTNTDAAAGYNIRMALHGYKIFKLTQS